MAAPQSTTQRYGSQITTVDPSQGLVEVVLKTGQTRQVLIVSPPPAFRWPMVGENWMVCQMNGTWYLEGIFPSTSAATDFHGVDPGDMILSSPTGVVHVIGGESGDTDFTIAQRTGKSSFTGVAGNPVNFTLTHSLGHTPACVLVMPTGWTGYISADGVTLTGTQVSLVATLGTGSFVNSTTYDYFFYVSL